MKDPRGTWLYFLQAGFDGPIKIGLTHRVRRRRMALQVANATPLTLLVDVPGTAAEERRLHDRFGAARIRGEWFRPTPELLELVEALGEGLRLGDWLEAASGPPAPPGAQERQAADQPHEQ